MGCYITIITLPLPGVVESVLSHRRPVRITAGIIGLVNLFVFGG